MQSPRVSVVMPTWNAETFLEEAVQSILSQTLTDLELIVVDGGSTDRTLEILDKLRDARVRVLAAPARGIVPALNFGIQEARAPWIARQDADDASFPRRLELQWNALTRDSKAAFSHTDVEFAGEGRHALGRPRFPRTAAFVALRLCTHCAMVHSTAMFNRQAVLALGGYRGEHAEDYDLWGRLIEQGQWIGVPEKLLKFRVHPVSLSSRNREPMQALAQEIAVRHCQRFMQLGPAEAHRAYATLLAGPTRSWKDWAWFLGHCVPRLRWKSAEMYAWIGIQSLRMVRSK
jgi:glycosyltransferase involved in cell wall biosynthesis